MSLDPFIDQRVFKVYDVPQDALVSDPAVTVEQLRGLATTRPIRKNSQISFTSLERSGGEPSG